MWKLKKFPASAVWWNQQLQTHLQHIFKLNGSLKIPKQRNRDENMWKNYENKIYTENKNINLENVEKVEMK